MKPWIGVKGERAVLNKVDVGCCLVCGRSVKWLGSEIYSDFMALSSSGAYMGMGWTQIPGQACLVSVT